MRAGLVELLSLMSIKDRAAKRGFIGRVAIGPQRHMPPGDDHLKRFGPRRTEYRNRVFLAKRALAIVLDFLFEFRVPVGMDQPLEDIMNEMLLFGRIIIAANLMLGNLPVWCHHGTKRHFTLGINVVPCKTNLFFLFIAERIIKSFDSSLGNRGWRRW